MLASDGDAAAVGELLDECELLFDGPAVVAGADGDGLEWTGSLGDVAIVPPGEKGGEAVISCRGL
jgi:hypothetical protein